MKARPEAEVKELSGGLNLSCGLIKIVFNVSRFKSALN